MILNKQQLIKPFSNVLKKNNHQLFILAEFLEIVLIYLIK